jgi:hypothetical protein
MKINNVDIVQKKEKEKGKGKTMSPLFTLQDSGDMVQKKKKKKEKGKSWLNPSSVFLPGVSLFTVL